LAAKVLVLFKPEVFGVTLDQVENFAEGLDQHERRFHEDRKQVGVKLGSGEDLDKGVDNSCLRRLLLQEVVHKSGELLEVTELVFPVFLGLELAERLFDAVVEGLQLIVEFNGESREHKLDLLFQFLQNLVFSLVAVSDLLRSGLDSALSLLRQIAVFHGKFAGVGAEEGIGRQGVSLAFSDFKEALLAHLVGVEHGECKVFLDLATLGENLLCQRDFILVAHD